MTVQADNETITGCSETSYRTLYDLFYMNHYDKHALTMDYNLPVTVTEGFSQEKGSQPLSGPHSSHYSGSYSPSPHHSGSHSPHHSGSPSPSPTPLITPSPTSKPKKSKKMKTKGKK